MLRHTAKASLFDEVIRVSRRLSKGCIVDEISSRGCYLPASCRCGADCWSAQSIRRYGTHNVPLWPRACTRITETSDIGVTNQRSASEVGRLHATSRQLSHRARAVARRSIEHRDVVPPNYLRTGGLLWGGIQASSCAVKRPFRRPGNRPLS